MVMQAIVEFMTDEIIFSEGDRLRGKKLLWSTDLHFDAANREEYLQFIERANEFKPDVVLIGGDICNGYNALFHLKILGEQIKKPIYFVLGNHDFYYGSIVKMRGMASAFSRKSSSVKYLVDLGVVELTRTTALIGHDGWADGLTGDFLNSTIQLNDYILIDELRNLEQHERLKKLNELGSEAAYYLEKNLLLALNKYRDVVLLTHVPPFREASLWEGKMSDDNWAPHFVSTTTGIAIKKVMEQHPSKKLLVLCGHTHGKANVYILPNLQVLTGASEYGEPTIQGLIFIN